MRSQCAVIDNAHFYYKHNLVDALLLLSSAHDGDFSEYGPQLETRGNEKFFNFEAAMLKNSWKNNSTIE